MLVYKVFTIQDWNKFEAEKIYHGSAHDQRDGFIHLSEEHQLDFVLKSFYHQESSVIIAQFGSTKFKQEIKWEEASNGDKFPHLYGELERKAVLKHYSQEITFSK